MLDQRTYAEAEQLLIITLQICINVPKVRFHTVDAIISRLATALLLNGRAEMALEGGIDRTYGANACLGEDSPTAIGTRRKPAECLRAVGRIYESETLFHATIRSMVRVLGERYPDTLQCMFHYGCTLISEARHSETEMWLRRSLEGSLKSLGREHRSTLYNYE